MLIKEFSEPEAWAYVGAARGIPNIWVVAVIHDNVVQVYKKTRKGIEKIAEAAAEQDKNDMSSHTRTYMIANIAAWLDRMAAQNYFERLVLVAPAGVLAEMRRILSIQLHKRVMAEVSKDLAPLSACELETLLEDIFWF